MKNRVQEPLNAIYDSQFHEFLINLARSVKRLQYSLFRQAGKIMYHIFQVPYCACHILVACSDKKESYKEFSKGWKVLQWYVLVWSKEKLNMSLDDFKALKANYSHMDVSMKDGAMKSFKKLGGVPRYVLCFAKSEDGLE